MPGSYKAPRAEKAWWLLFLLECIAVALWDFHSGTNNSLGISRKDCWLESSVYLNLLCMYKMCIHISYFREFDCWPFLQHLPVFQVWKKKKVLIILHSVPGSFILLTLMDIKRPNFCILIICYIPLFKWIQQSKLFLIVVCMAF